MQQLNTEKIKIMCKFVILLLLLTTANQAFAALPFATDDAAIANRNQLLIEEYTEIWHLPKKSDNESSNLLGQYLGLAYGLSDKLEVGVAALAGYDFHNQSLALMNPILQVKSVIFQPKNTAIPSVAISAGYVNKNGRGQYYDTATNYYLIGILSSYFFDNNLIVHVNSGPKVSYDLPTGKNLYRTQLGVAIDVALLRKDFRLFMESYNGTPNSPRDSPGYFHSYQAGFKFIKSNNLAFSILYGSQPVFMGYDESNDGTYRRTSTIQFGVRKVIDNFF